MENLIVYLVVAPLAFILGIIVGALFHHYITRSPKVPAKEPKKEAKASNERPQNKGKKKVDKKSSKRKK